MNVVIFTGYDSDLSKTEPAGKLTCIFWSHEDYHIFALGKSCINP